VHSLLHACVEILYTEAEPVHAEPAQVCQACRRDGTGIDLDRYLGVAGDPETTPQRQHDPIEFGIGKKGR